MVHIGRAVEVLVVVLASCSRTGLDSDPTRVPSEASAPVQPLATKTCRKLAITVPPTRISADKDYPRIVQRGDSLDVVFAGSPSSSVRHLTYANHTFEIGEPTAIDDLFQCAIAETTHRLGALCKDAREMRLYDEAFHRVSAMRRVVSEDASLMARDDRFYLLDTGSADFEIDDESGATVPSTAPFPPSSPMPILLPPTLMTWLAPHTLVVGAMSLVGTDRFQLNLEFRELDGSTNAIRYGTEQLPRLSNIPSMRAVMAPWPYTTAAVFFATFGYNPNVFGLELADRNGFQTFLDPYDVPQEFSWLGAFPMPWGLALVLRDSENASIAWTAREVSVIGADGNRSTPLALRWIGIGDPTFAIVGEEIIALWRTIDGLFGGAIGCAQAD